MSEDTCETGGRDGWKAAMGRCTTGELDHASGPSEDSMDSSSLRTCSKRRLCSSVTSIPCETTFNFPTRIRATSSLSSAAAVRIRSTTSSHNAVHGAEKTWNG